MPIKNLPARRRPPLVSPVRPSIRQSVSRSLAQSIDRSVSPSLGRSVRVSRNVVGGWVARSVRASVSRVESIDLSSKRVGGRVARLSLRLSFCLDRAESISDLSLDRLGNSFGDKLRQSIQDLVLA